MELPFDPTKQQCLQLYSHHFERISSWRWSCAVSSVASTDVAPRPPHARARSSAAVNVFRDTSVVRDGRHW